MDGHIFPEAVQHWATYLLALVGFGTVVGLLAKAILPGRDEGGAVTTLLMGVGGTVIGAGLLALAWGRRISPLSPLGFVASTAGAFILLFFHRLLAGSFVRRKPPAVRAEPRRRAVVATRH
jgi:uncharacterized membrane protein YeaQ/YmgE (transglycosylase-associated protein family)